ncbi:MAG: hypothetical protein HFE58_04720 [Firmicutes bacterium]|nr:hypothetical protein [Bacillota bacterium]
MKKIIALVTAITIATSSMAITSYAKGENDVIPSEDIELWEDVLDNLEEDEYAGAYVKDGQLHIKAKDSEELQTAMLEAVPQTRGASNIVVEGKADYTLQELNEASNKSVEVWKELDLDFVAVDEEYNALIVGAYEWTEEKKQTFIEAVGIQNVIFQTVDPLEEQQIEYVTEENKEEIMENEDAQITKDGTEIYVGRQILNKNIKDKKGNYAVSTIGACVVGNGSNIRRGFVTTAHTNAYDKNNKPIQSSKGDAITGNFSGLNDIGKIYDRVISASKGIDIAIIEANSGIKLNSEIYTQDASNSTHNSRGTLIGSRKPIKGYYCYIFPGYSTIKNPYYEEIELMISSVNCKKVFDEVVDDNGEEVFYNMLMFKIVGSKRTQGGDSGSPIAMQYDNEGNYELIGIYKGASTTGYNSELSSYMENKASTYEEDRTDYKYLFATNWQQVEKHFNVVMY